ncbi:MAG: hypothetical protein ACHREM_12825 [Polyangiales bacterium]
MATYDPCEHQWRDFVDALQDEKGCAWGSEDLNRLEALRQDIVERGIRRTAERQSAGMGSALLTVPIVAGVVLMFDFVEWATLMSAVWATTGDASSSDDWGGGDHAYVGDEMRTIALTVPQNLGGMSIYVSQCIADPGHGMVFATRRPYGRAQPIQSTLALEYKPDSEMASVVSAEHWDAVVVLVLEAWREHNRTQVASRL